MNTVLSVCRASTNRNPKVYHLKISIFLCPKLSNMCKKETLFAHQFPQVIHFLEDKPKMTDITKI